MSLLPALYRSNMLPQIAPLNTNALHKEIPVLPIIEKEDPESYERIMVPLKSAVRRGNFNQKELNEFRTVYFQLIDEKSILANEEVLRGIYTVSIEQFKTLRDVAPEVCTKQINSLPFPPIDSYMSSDFIKKEQDALVKLFSTKPRAETIQTDIYRGETLFDEFATQVVEDLVITDFNPMDMPNSFNKSEHQKLCDFSVALANFMISLDDQDFYNVTDYLNQP